MALSHDPLYILGAFDQLKSYYSQRNAALLEGDAFFRGIQWEGQTEIVDPDTTVEEEDLRLVLNYTRKAVFWHVGLLTGKSPRIDVPMSLATPDPSAAAREQYLRAVVSTPIFRRAYRRCEMSASKAGFGVMQVVWSPSKGQPVTRDLPAVEGAKVESQVQEYTDLPITFRAIDPMLFYPRYRTYDTPNDFLYVMRYDPERLVEDIEDKYGVKLAPTSSLEGSAGTCELVEYWDDDRYLLLAVMTTVVSEWGKDVERRVPHVLLDKANAYGKIPFFVLPNVVQDPFRDPTYGGTISEVTLVTDPNKYLNFVFSLTATEIATRIHPPVAYKTDDPSQDPHDIRVGAGEVIPIRTDESLEPLNWAGVPQVVLAHQEAAMQAIRDFGGLPKTAMGEVEAGSGIGMKLAMTVLEMILPLKVPERVEFLQDVLGFVLQLTDKALRGEQAVSLWVPKGQRTMHSRVTKRDIDGAYACLVQFGNLIPRDKVANEQHVVYMFKTSTISHKTALELLEDVPDPEQELERLKLENQDPVLNPERAAMIKQSQKPQPSAQPPQPPQGMPLKYNAAPPVPVNPEMPTQQNAPFLERGMPPNLGQMFPGGPGVNVGPPVEEQM